jgi:imidazolonepropionase-like amidohydrolase
MSIRALIVGVALLGSAQAADTLLIKNVTLIDGTGAPPLEKASVLVEGERIALVSPAEIKAPRGTEVIDGKGKFLMPGIINSHIHLPGGRTGPGNRQLVMNVELGAEAMHGMLYAGVTAVYDSGNHDNYAFKMRDDERSGRILGPRLFTTGRLLTHGQGYQCCAGGIQVTDFDGTVGAVDALIARRPDMIKFTRESRGMGAKSEDLALIPLDVMTRLVEHIHEAGIRVTVHVSDEALARESLAAGVDAFAHPVYLSEQNIALARTIAARRIPVSTTMGRADTDVAIFDQPIFAATMTDEDRAENKGNPMYTNSPAGSWRGSLMAMIKKNIKQLHDAGAILAMGTDRSMGAYVHREMELLSEAGIPNLAITRMATLNAALYIGVEKDLGSIERGKLADLLLLSADPIADIRNTVRIDAVFKGGKKIDRSNLNVPANHK